MPKKSETLGKGEVEVNKTPKCKFKKGDKVRMINPDRCDGVVEGTAYVDDVATWYISIVDNNGNEQISKECNFKKI